MHLHKSNPDDADAGDAAQAAKRLLAAATAVSAGLEGAAAAAALQRTCSRVTDNLRDALGRDGCDALFARAMARTEGAHTALKDICRVDSEGVHMDQVGLSIEKHGVGTVHDAIEAFLTAVIDVLGRLVGENLAIGLINQGGARASSNGRRGSP
jgi:hypothetical protein